MQAMLKWNITPQDPGEFTLAADARCTTTNYVNDHIWELSYQNITPPALALQTTFGLRARSFRIFPRFTEGDVAIVDPANFDTLPVVHNFGPNFVSVSYYPLPGILVESHYCVLESNVIGGKITITNKKLQDRELSFELATVLSPDENGHRMSARRIENVNILAGKTHNLHPVLFITGGAQEGTGPFAALTFNLELSPGAYKTFTWAMATAESEEASFHLARKNATGHLEAAIARAELLAESAISIKTGDKDWDTAFALSQKTAFGLLMSPTSDFPGTSFVVNRLPEQGYSAQGDGNDYQLNWSGQTPLQAEYLSGLITSTAPQITQDLLQNFLAFQTEEGFIPKKVGLGEQKSDTLAMPILSNMAWRIYTSTGSKEFLQDVFPKLEAFVRSWFTPEQDKDKDGIPEWTNSRQSGFEAHPSNISNPNWVLHPVVSMTEEPALCALLSHELQILIQMAEILEKEDAIKSLQAMKEILGKAIQESWDKENTIYYRWDKDTHFSPAGKILKTGTGAHPLNIQLQFEYPVRLLIQIEAADSPPTQLDIFIHGYEGKQDEQIKRGTQSRQNKHGKHRVERLISTQFQWHLKTGKGMSQHTYAYLEYIDIYGLGKGDKITIHIADYRTEDISLLLPLWSGDASQKNAQKLIKETITDTKRFWFPFGLRSTPHEENPTVLMPWNTLIGKGLIKYGERDTAAELVGNLMRGVIKNLKESGKFYTSYHAETGQGLQEYNTVDGLAPLELFLETLGLKILSPHKIALEGRNPFPWAVTVTYRGTHIERKKWRTIITFPDGQSTTITTAHPRVVSIENTRS